MQTEIQIELRPTVIHCRTPKTDAQLVRLEQLLDARAKELIDACEAEEHALIQTQKYLEPFWRMNHAAAN